MEIIFGGIDYEGFIKMKNQIFFIGTRSVLVVAQDEKRKTEL